MNVQLKTSYMDKFFNPSSVVIIGASNAVFNLGATICLSLKQYVGYHGAVYAVNRKGEEVHGCPGYSSVRDLPGGIDLAVIIAPASVVPGFVRECGEKGIRNIVIESAEFAEQGEDGKRLQREIDEAARQHGIRIIGPNCLGVLDAHSPFCCFYGVNEEISNIVNKKGDVSYIIQSGGVVSLVLGSLKDDITAINKIASIGNKSDIDEADLIEHFSHDNTRVIALYLEHVVRGDRLMEVAKRTTKPVLVFKSGRSEQGIAAAVSHTAGMANNDAVFESACSQAGIIRLKTINELYSLPKIFTEMPLLSGNRVAVFTNSGAFGIISADLLAGSGLAMVRLLPETREKLKKLKGIFNVNNPVDIGPAPPQIYLDIYEILLSAGEVDGILHMVGMWRDFVIEGIKELVRMCRHYNKPAAIYTFNAMSQIRSARKGFHLPLFDTAEEAVRALVVSHEQFRYMRKKEGSFWTK
jgi:acyl-CoA synthetase (NDP forming)